MLTAARSAEVRLATWGEMDLVAMVWTVPGRRMKAKREHRVPPYGRAVEVLREAEHLPGASNEAGDEALVFPTVRGKALGAATISKLVRNLGIAAAFSELAGVEMATMTLVVNGGVVVGTATIRVTATDPGGLSPSQTFTVTVTRPANRPPEPVGARSWRRRWRTP